MEENVVLLFFKMHVTTTISDYTSNCRRRPGFFDYSILPIECPYHFKDKAAIQFILLVCRCIEEVLSHSFGNTLSLPFPFSTLTIIFHLSQ